MKKGNVFFGLLVLLGILILIHSVHAQLPSGIDTEQLENDSVVRGVETLQQTVEEQRWKFITDGWKELLLKNRFLSAFDKFMQKISIVVFVLFGQQYAFSFQLLLVVLLWIFFFLIWKSIIETYSAFSKNVGVAISFALCLIQAHLKMLSLQADFIMGLFKAMVNRNKVWWVLSFIVVFLVYLMILTLLKRFLRGIKAKKDRDSKEQEKLDRKILRTTVEGIEEANDKLDYDI